MASDEDAGFLGKVRATALSLWKNITIEPVVMLYLTAYGLNAVRFRII